MLSLRVQKEVKNIEDQYFLYVMLENSKFCLYLSRKQNM